jgi:HK97 family phage major capsid protein/HK97 family phage prohead protease
MESTLLQQIKSASYGRLQSFALREEDVSGDEMTFSFSSEEPIERWWGTEILSHEKGCARLDRMNDRGAFLFNHKRDVLLGSSLKAWLADDKRAYITVKWSSRDDVKGYKQDCEDGHLTHASFAYDIFEVVENVKKEEYTVTDWEVFEVSLVTVPADPSVGVGRDRDRPIILGADKPIIVLPSQRSFEPTIIKEKEVKTTVTETITPPAPATGPTEAEIRAQIETATNTAAQQERDRIRAVQILGDRHNMRELSQAAIEDGTPIESFRALVLDKLGEVRQEPIAKPASPLGLTQKERDRYSIVRALNAALTGNWEKAGLEREASVAIEDQRGKDPGTHGFYVPMYDGLKVQRDAATAGRDRYGERASYQVGTANLGGITVETDIYPEMLDYLRNIPLVAQFGAKFWSGLQGNLDILRQLTYTSVGWMGEDQALPEGNATFGSFGIRPKDLGAWSRITRRMLQQNTIDIENFVREELMLGIALEMDRAAIHGSGVGFEPRGVLNTPGIGSVALGTNGGAPTWDSIVRLETMVGQANGLVGNMAYMTTPGARGKLKTTPKSASFVSEFIWTDAGQALASGNLGMLNGYQAGATNQVRADLTKGTGTALSALIFGCWAEVIIAEWGYLKVDVNPYGDDDFLKDALKIKAIHTADIQVGRASRFAAITDMLTT